MIHPEPQYPSSVYFDLSDLGFEPWELYEGFRHGQLYKIEKTLKIAQVTDLTSNHAIKFWLLYNWAQSLSSMSLWWELYME